jgi:hypothetical protein
MGGELPFAALANSNGLRKVSGRSRKRPSILRCATAAKPTNGCFCDVPISIIPSQMQAEEDQEATVPIIYMLRNRDLSGLDKRCEEIDCAQDSPVERRNDLPRFYRRAFGSKVRLPWMIGLPWFCPAYSIQKLSNSSTWLSGGIS